MLMYEAFQKDGKIPITINVEYDEELDLYVVEVTRGLDTDFKTFTPKHVPVDKLMNISDMEKSVKLANVILKSLKREAYRRNEWVQN